jgi:hypothetical protein
MPIVSPSGGGCVMPRQRSGRHLRSRPHLDLDAAFRAAAHGRHSRGNRATHLGRRSPIRAALAVICALSLVGALSLLLGAPAGSATFPFLPRADMDVASSWETSGDASGSTTQFQGWLVASGSKSYSLLSGSGVITVTVDCSGRAEMKVALINSRGYTETAYTKVCSRGPISVSKTVSVAGSYTVKLTELAGFSTGYTATVLSPATTASTPATSTTTAAVTTTSTSQASNLGVTTTTSRATTTAAASSGKIWLALYLQYIDVRSQFDIYNQNTDGGDITRLRANGNSDGLCDTGMKPQYVTSAQALPGAAGTAYKCSRAIVENAGFAIAEFNFETGFNIPEDNNDPLAAVRRASNAAHAAGLQLRCTPDRQLTKNLAGQFAPYCDYYHIQAQSLQPDGVGAYSTFVHDIVAKLKAANPRLQGKITVQVSPGRGAPSGKDVQQHMRDCVDSVMDVADGASMWFGGNELHQLRSFVAWFDMKYGS